MRAFSLGVGSALHTRGERRVPMRSFLTRAARLAVRAPACCVKRPQERQRGQHGQGPRSQDGHTRSGHGGALSLAAAGVVLTALASGIDQDKQGTIQDVVVIGGGVVGLAVARELVVKAAAKARHSGEDDSLFQLTLLEQADVLCSGVSSGNSGIGCTGYDAPAGSLERALLRRSISRHQELYRSLGLSYDHVRKCGALVVAWTEEELAQLPHILEENHAAGDTDAVLLSQQELQAMEPSLSKDALGAVLAPREVVAEPWLVPIAFAASALSHGATLTTGCKVKGASFDPDTRLWSLQTTQGPVHARAVVNCAGLFGDEVEKAAFPTEAQVGATPFTIQPRKGQFVVYESLADFDASPWLVIQPVPTQRTKGVIVWASVYGNIVVGPTAEDQESRTDRSTDEHTISLLMQHGERVLPALRDAQVVGTYSGIRPATQHRDYVIQARPAEAWITVGGIRSTGLTAASGIAEHVSGLYERCLLGGEPVPGEALVKWRGVEPPFPAARLSPVPLHRNPPAPSLTSLAEDYRARGDGCVEVFGSVHRVTHPLSYFGMATMRTEDMGLEVEVTAAPVAYS